MSLDVSQTGATSVSVLSDENNIIPFDWSADGKYILLGKIDPWTQQDVWYAERGADGSWSIPRQFLTQPYGEEAPVFSPDGRYVAFVSNRTGRFEVYVSAFPELSDIWHVSESGGTQPRWSVDGSEIYYVRGSGLVAVSVSLQGEFRVGKQEELFRGEFLGRWGTLPEYDVSADGQRFVIQSRIGEVPSKAIQVVLNWQSLLQQ